MRFGLALCAGVWIGAAAQAQELPPGIAFVQAPEQSSGMGVSPDITTAITTAMHQCVGGGAAPEDCIITNWCQPAGWSIDLFVMHVEGIHWHEVTCGLTERSIAEAVAAQICADGARDYVSDCSLVQLYDPNGEPQM